MPWDGDFLNCENAKDVASAVAYYIEQGCEDDNNATCSTVGGISDVTFEESEDSTVVGTADCYEYDKNYYCIGKKYAVIVNVVEIDEN